MKIKNDFNLYYPILFIFFTNDCVSPVKIFSNLVWLTLFENALTAEIELIC